MLLLRLLLQAGPGRSWPALPEDGVERGTDGVDLDAKPGAAVVALEPALLLRLVCGVALLHVRVKDRVVGAHLRTDVASVHAGSAADGEKWG